MVMQAWLRIVTPTKPAVLHSVSHYLFVTTFSIRTLSENSKLGDF